MRKLFIALAITVLLVTTLCAGAVFYGIYTLAPVVEETFVTVMPASQAPELFEQLASQLENGTFSGKRYADMDSYEAEDYVFVSCIVRLKNRGVFPAEWVSLEVLPAENDVLALPDSGAHALAAGGRGDISATLLHLGEEQSTARTMTVTCYVFGQQFKLPAKTE